MSIKYNLYRFTSKIKRMISGREYASPLAKFARHTPVLSYGSSDLAQVFKEHTGRAVNKWQHYLDIYEFYLKKYRGDAVRILEIGVFEGGSLEVWRKYLGAKATIFGIDISPECAGYADAPNQIRIGSQDDPRFLETVLREMGGLDIVLDDGSHIGRHQKASFDFLWPRLSAGGLYIIEDVHTAYFPGFEGGHGRRGTAIEFTKTLIDDLHHHYHDKARIKDVGALHFHDSMVFIEKRNYPAPIPITAPSDGKRVQL